MSDHPKGSTYIEAIKGAPYLDDFTRWLDQFVYVSKNDTTEIHIAWSAFLAGIQAIKDRVNND